jgi:hypothetical protein
MNINITQSGQGLLSVDINGKPSDWKISNRNGVWNLYQPRGYGCLLLSENLAKIIHKPEQLAKKVGELIHDCEK